MDDKTFDSFLKLSVTSTGRRRLFQAMAAAGVGGLLTRGGVSAATTQACQNLGTKCDRNRQCQCRNRENVICDPLARGCKSGNRCCSVAKGQCDRDCDCCKGYQCNRNQHQCERT